VATGSHLSIGEVLSLLQEEFPGVTISKIRFLESQGLVDPERTPSGYRKFYEADIERLRWVLRQQRDAYLPLRVIKGRLEGQDDPPTGQEPQEPLSQLPGEDAAGEPVAGEDRAGEDRAGEDRAGEDGAGKDGAGEDRAGEDRAGEDRAGEDRAGKDGAGKDGAGKDGAGAIEGLASHAQLFDAGPPYAAVAAKGTGEPLSGRPMRGGTGNGLPSSRAEGPRRRSTAVGRHGEARGSRVGPVEAPSDLVAAAGEDELALEELISVAGVDIETIQDLERYGLIAPRLMGGVPYYSGDAAVIAQLAAAFARHGVEARHLRAYKGAAEREAGMVQQVIMPLIRQRNPQARQAAAQAVEELSHLGGQLRAAFLRSALADMR